LLVREEGGHAGGGGHLPQGKQDITWQRSRDMEARAGPSRGLKQSLGRGQGCLRA
jgi:hypothetical protein